tara:strand:- start:2908 stop:3825 length:918 start_codon:yes stop_codon:yes gene_type:complete
MIKVGIIGCSSIAERCVIPAIKQVKGIELIAIASRDIEKARNWCNKFDAEPYTYNDILKSNVDMIYVSLPPALHFEWGKKVLMSGKNLLMEKTFTMDLEEATELFCIAKDRNLRCMEALMYEFHPVHNKIDSLLKEIGDIKHVDASFGFPYFQNKNDIRYSKELGGGSILDSLIYPLSFVFRVLGKQLLDYNTFFIEKDVIERGVITLKYKNAFANINFGFGQAYRNEIKICGSDKILKAQRVFSRTENCENPIEIVHNGNVTTHEIEKSNHFVNMIKYFISAQSLETKKENTLLRLRFMDEIRK